MTRRDLTYAEWRHETESKRNHWQHREAVQDAIDAGVAALAVEPTDAEALSSEIERLSERLVGRGGRLLDHYGREMSTDFPFVVIDRVLSEESSHPADLKTAFYGLVSVAEFEDLVDDKSNHSEAHGFSLPVGRVYSDMEMDFGDRVKVVTRDSGWPCTLFCGKTGQGKSTTLETEVEDRYNNGQKIIDVVDTDEFENATYDIPQSQDELLEVRDDFELPATFEESEDAKNPNLEILVPVHGSTEGMDIVTGPDGETVIRPFTIPAADLGESTLVMFLTAMLSKQQEASIRTAYNKMSGDWSLEDLARQIARRDDLGDKLMRRILRLLEDLQDKGFVRDRDCEYAIDWEDIFRDEETITAFSVAPLPEIDQFITMSYLSQAIYQERKDFNELPPAAAVMRELHEIVPHREEAAADNRINALQSAITTNLAYTMKKNRHERLELLADTQYISDLKKGVRKKFDRFVGFKMPKQDLKMAFNTIGEGGYDSCRNSIPTATGAGAVIGTSQPAVDKDLSFVSPIYWAPASFHHFDVDRHATGLHARVDLLGNEWDTADWQAKTPEELAFTTPSIMGDETENHLQAFADKCLTVEEDVETPVHEVLDAYENYCAQHDYEAVGRTWFVRKFRDQVDNYAIETQERNQGRVYSGIRLSVAGREYLPAGGAEASTASAAD